MDTPATPTHTMLRRSWIGVVGWAMFLACSWTWCIGMFLPILLVRDLGPWSFAAFAVPNVLGAAAFGWVLAQPDASARFVAKHRIACRMFSQITIAFQIFFLLWLWVGIPGLGEPLRQVGLSGAAVWLGVLAGVLALVWPAQPGRGIAAIVWGFSLTALLVWAVVGLPHAAPLPSPSTGAVTGLIFMTPVIVFGFVLCPYLDLTFHQARQGCTAAGARWAFTLGFGGFFLVMIVGTLAYAPLALNPQATVSLATALISLHIVLQLLFTIGVHRAADAQAARPGDSAITTIGAGALLLAAAGLILGAFWSPDSPILGGLSLPETIYRVFMACYGLAFPAYVWLCVVPAGDGSSGPTRATMRIWALAVGIAAPMFWVGFIMRIEIMLLMGLLAVLLARLALPGGAGLPRRSSRAPA